MNRNVIFFAELDGPAEKMYKALAEAKGNIQMLSTGEIKIACISDREAADGALPSAHAAFEINDEATD